MFALFFNLYLAMLRGSWVNFSTSDIKSMLTSPIDGIGIFLTSIFNDGATSYSTLGQDLFIATSSGVPNYLAIVAFILALITSIGIVVMAVKGIKRVFGVFFMGIR